MLLHKVIPKKWWYSSYRRTETKVFVTKYGVFHEKEFLAKEVSGTTVQLDKIKESSLSCQGSATKEIVPEFTIMTDV